MKVDKEETGVKENGRGWTGGSFPAVWGLCAALSLKKILLVLLAMAAAEALAFYGALRGLSGGEACRPPEKLVEDIHLGYFFVAALGAVYFILVWTSAGQKKDGEALLLRLQCTPKGQYGIRTLYNMFCLVLLTAVQLVLVFWLWGLYRDRLPEELVSPQYLFLLFYRSPFLHCLLPLADAGVWLVNGLMGLTLAMEAAGGGRNRAAAVFVFFLAAVWTVTDRGTTYILLSCLPCLVSIAEDLVYLRREEKGRLGGGGTKIEKT